MNRVKQIFAQCVLVTLAGGGLVASDEVMAADKRDRAASCQLDQATKRVILPEGRYAARLPKEALYGGGELDVARVYASDGTALSGVGLIFDRAPRQGRQVRFRCVLVPVDGSITQDVETLDVRRIDFTRQRRLPFSP